MFSKCELWAKDSRGGTGQLYPRARIDVLPDDVLREIFTFCVGGYHVNEWHKLVHVCRRWRHVVYASPLGLNLRLLCTNSTPTRKMLDIWPAFPIVIRRRPPRFVIEASNILAALEHDDRVCEIDVQTTCKWFLHFSAMEKPFPLLAHLYIYAENVTFVSDSFLGGSAPHLRTLTLHSVSFQRLPELLLSAHDLVRLDLWRIPDPGYSPEVMATCLSSSTNLETLILDFGSPQPQVDQHPHPLTRTVLPALTCLVFNGSSEYLFSRIDIPLLGYASIMFFKQPLFNIPGLSHAISHTKAFKALHRADMCFSSKSVSIKLVRGEGMTDGTMLELGILCKPSDQLSSLAQVCNLLSLPSLPTLKRLEIRGNQYVLRCKLWLNGKIRRKAHNGFSTRLSMWGIFT